MGIWAYISIPTIPAAPAVPDIPAAPAVTAIPAVLAATATAATAAAAVAAAGSALSAMLLPLSFRSFFNSINTPQPVFTSCRHPPQSWPRSILSDSEVQAIQFKQTKKIFNRNIAKKDIKLG